jgi:hypothetical protein
VLALVLQTGVNLTNYSSDVFSVQPTEEERTLCLAAVITGKIDVLPNHSRDLFRHHSYMSERF